jgi:hypothetical protein
MPEKSVDVLVYRTDESIQVSCCFDSPYDGVIFENRDLINSACYEDVTHWMPLPSKPKQEKNE